MSDQPRVRQLRLVLTVADYDEAVRFYRDALGLAEHASYSSADGRVTILEAGRATLELADPRQAEYIDRVEVGRRVAGDVRVAFEVDDAAEVTAALADAGAEVIAAPTRTPWNSAQRSAGGAGRSPDHPLCRVGIAPGDQPVLGDARRPGARRRRPPGLRPTASGGRPPPTGSSPNRSG